MTIIDSHHHFWNFNESEYGWIPPHYPQLRRDFGPAELKREIDHVGIDGVISVQARQTLAETEWLLAIAEQHDFIRGVVGWVPLTDPRLGETLAKFAAHPKLRSVRHLLQDEADPHYMLRDDFNRGVAQLRQHRLVYDLVIFERHLPQAIAFVDRHPEQIFVLDHIAKPRIRDYALEPWRKHIRELARRPNVFCKVSGMATEADHQTWAESRLWVYYDVVCEAFTPRRLMFGSDWPVCLMAVRYAQWFDTVELWTETLTAAERAALMGETAIQAYGLQS